MNVNDRGIDPARVVTIETRIDQAFAFAQDVIECPELLDDIPDGATLYFRDVVYEGITLRLTAHPNQSRPGWWTARVTGPLSVALPSRQWTPPVGVCGAGRWGSPPTYPEGGPTPKEALDALQEKLG